MLIAEFLVGIILVFLIGYLIGKFFKLSYTKEFSSLKERKESERIKEPEYAEEKIER